MRLGESNRWLRRVTSCALVGSVVGLLLSLWSPPAFSETVVVTPSCAVPGQTKVCITGSGWPEPSPPCRYRFFFDGARPGALATDQQDGLFGPPLRAFTVPMGTAAGDHNITVDLLQNSNNMLLGGPVTKPLKVVAISANPFTPTPAPTTNRIDIAFDPTNVCEVGTCSKIAFIQVGQVNGLKGDGTSQVLKVSELKGFSAAAATEYDANTSANKFFLDRFNVRATPYFGGNGAGTGHWVMGSNDKTPIVVAKMDDGPTLPGPKAAGFVKLTVNFETAAFCVSGPDMGRFYGIVNWKYETDLFNGGTLNKSTFISSDRNAQPSGNFKGGLNAWLANPKHTTFKLPTSGLPQCQ